MKKVLFVCTGNTCRSPMAEALFTRMLQLSGYPADEIRVESAGLYAWENDQATPEAIEVMSQLGIDLTGHRSRSIDDAMVQEADLILTMTRNHRDKLQELFPHLRSKIYTLAEYAGQPDEEIPDPYGQNIETYQQALQQIKSLLEKIIVNQQESRLN
ncbi:MAG TPA: low molecular weight protein arginine phosphatase [Syntrophomonadaceae bacterium]|nr:low molecular weight protein arginine phosphatase [Syntrophomonadaceae bacterium]HQA06592.1 low molecular weight protein arginine phosphatase [Syntrophomonadaceae bacterium]HQE22335.1 low molecular weight protein arginine phosphatase [Syntrophomonadaceae bacterium]